MSDASRHDRFRLIALLSLAAITALGSFWLVEVLRQSLPVHASTDKQNDPDYYVDNFHFVRIANTGQPHYMMSGKSLVHRPVTDQSLVKEAQMLSFSPEHAPLVVNSHTALLDHQKNIVELKGQVRVVRTDTAVSQGWQLNTEALTVRPDEDKLDSSEAVELKNNRSVTNAIGMQIDNTKGTLKLNQQVHGVFQPAPAPTQAAAKSK